jgi:hypothetical protein
VVFIDLVFVAIVFVAVVFVLGVLASQWIRSCVQGVDMVFIFSEIVA